MFWKALDGLHRWQRENLPESGSPQGNDVLVWLLKNVTSARPLKDLYRGSRFQEALASFEQALALHPGDRLSALYADRCRHYLAEPPGADWDGIWVMQEK